MTDKQKQYEAELLQVIKEKKIAFLDHCFAFTSFSAATSYNKSKIYAQAEEAIKKHNLHLAIEKQLNERR